MIVLAVESSTELAGVALADDDGVIATATSARGRQHAETIAPAIAFVCRHGGVALRDLGAVVVDVGPGLFTGLRVGVGSAKALAFALGVPVVAVSSLEVVARAAMVGAPDGALVAPVVDARRGEVFAARLRGVAPGVLAWVAPPGRCTPTDLAAELRALGEPVLLAGNGARRHAAVLETAPGARRAGPNADHPVPGVLAMIGVGRAAAGEGVDGATVVPDYRRDADTRINWERRAPRPEAVR